MLETKAICDNMVHIGKCSCAGISPNQLVILIEGASSSVGHVARLDMIGDRYGGDQASDLTLLGSGKLWMYVHGRNT